MNEVALLVPIFAIVFSFGFAAFAVAIGAKTKQKRWEALASVQNRMLERFGSAQEFTEFLKTPEGRSYMLVAVEKGEGGQPARILASIRWGVVMAALGIGFLALSAAVDNDFVVPGVLMLSLGVGFLASSLISSRLARSWGMLSHESEGGAESIR
ncbi:MAG: hypothetical protein WC538_17055 [Thermoanaerobaculia bacterium]|jgi:hypothetical protein